jgi:rhodanese-related sulfurtransferase
MVVLDSRPFDEYARVSIPGAVNVPGAELVLRIHDTVSSPRTLVVVNCAGRTRSLIGAQSLINAGVPNKVVALRNGTMGWTLAGLVCEHGKARRPPQLSANGIAWARAAAERVAGCLDIPRIDTAALDRFRAESQMRTLYLLDVRDPSEYEAGHLAGAVSAPGGQLVQATDQYIGTLGARIVLVDDREVRALMTASWLRQMGWKDVFVLALAGTETGWPHNPILGAEPPRALRIDIAELSAALARQDATVVDLSLGRNYAKAHIPGAWFAIRARLDRALEKIPASGGPIVLTSEDGVLAGLAAPEARALTSRPVRCLGGGNAAWQAGGHPLTADDPLFADDLLDSWVKPYERPGDTAKAMADYLAWETDLLPRIERDGSTNFRSFPR